MYEQKFSTFYLFLISEKGNIHFVRVKLLFSLQTNFSLRNIASLPSLKAMSFMILWKEYSVLRVCWHKFLFRGSICGHETSCHQVPIVFNQDMES